MWQAAGLWICWETSRNTSRRPFVSLFTDGTKCALHSFYSNCDEPKRLEKKKRMKINSSVGGFVTAQSGNQIICRETARMPARMNKVCLDPNPPKRVCVCYINDWTLARQGYSKQVSDLWQSRDAHGHVSRRRLIINWFTGVWSQTRGNF